MGMKYHLPLITEICVTEVGNLQLLSEIMGLHRYEMCTIFYQECGFHKYKISMVYIRNVVYIGMKCVQFISEMLVP